MYFVLKNEDVKNNCIEQIKALDGVYRVTVDVYKKDRSHAQNRLMWMWLGIISNETGTTPEDLHQILKMRFLGTEVISALGYVFEQPKSTTKLTAREFTNYLDKIEGLAISLNIRLPHPEIYNEAMK